MTANVFLMIFAIGFLGCVLVTPLVTRLAAWTGAVDRPDSYRRVHTSVIPRLGGLGLAAGLLAAILPIVLGGYLRDWDMFSDWWSRQWAVALAAAIVLALGAIDDTRGMRPRLKLLGQAAAVLVLMAGGIRIEGVAILGVYIPTSYPLGVALPLLNQTVTVDLPSAAITLIWFLGCMNVWNLIDGMDGLATGVGLLVSSTLMLVAIHQGNYGSAALAAALAGGLAGFLLYNWHPACIFLGDSGSLLIGLLIGVIGVQDSLKGTTAVSILFPILAMGLPISDTAMAIFRRWVRNLPVSAADRRHVHHLLMGLGLGQRKAAAVLYFFTAGLCGIVLLGVAWNNEVLALILGASGCLAFLLILTSRRDELASLWGDLMARSARKRHERMAAEVTWETIQKIELSDGPTPVWEHLLAAVQLLGGEALSLRCRRDGQSILDYEHAPPEAEGVSGPSATFRLPSGPDLFLTVSLRQAEGDAVPADIAFRALQRLALAASQRLEHLFEAEREAWAGPTPPEALPALAETPKLDEPAVGPPNWAPIGWLRGALGLRAAAVGPLGDK